MLFDENIFLINFIFRATMPTIAVVWAANSSQFRILTPTLIIVKVHYAIPDA